MVKNDDTSHERDLVERCRRGDAGAFQELIDQYKQLVFALIARTVQDRARAEAARRSENAAPAIAGNRTSVMSTKRKFVARYAASRGASRDRRWGWGPSAK